MLPKFLESKILSNLTLKNLAYAKANHITKDSFSVFPEIWSFQMDYLRQYEEFPSHDILLANFPDFEINPCESDSDFDYCIAEMVKKNVQKRATKVLQKGVEMLSENPYHAVDYIQKRLSTLITPNHVNMDVTDKNALNRLEQYKQKKLLLQAGKRIGIKTGLAIFDDKHIGWRPGALIGIISRFGIGKSFLAIYMAVQAYLDGKRVVFVSPEMIVDEVNARWDVIAAYQMGYPNFSNESLLTGFGNIDEDEYKEFLESVSHREAWWTYDSDGGKPFTISSIEAFIIDRKPDLVVIDGLMLMEDEERTDDSWQKIKNLSYGLKSLATRYKVVIIAAHQANRDAEGKNDNMPTTKNIAMGDALGQACDYIITMASKEGEEKKRYIELPKVRAGRQQKNRLCISFDVDKGNIGEVL